MVWTEAQGLRLRGFGERGGSWFVTVQHRLTVRIGMGKLAIFIVPESDLFRFRKLYVRHQLWASLCIPCQEGAL